MAGALDHLSELARTGAPRRVGGKASNLARLVAAGLPVPEGLVVSPPSGTPVARAAEELAALARPHLAGLGPRLAVRSSASVEDGVEGSAAGLFVSCTDVGVDDLAAAIEEVLRSADSPAVTA